MQPLDVRENFGGFADLGYDLVARNRREQRGESLSNNGMVVDEDNALVHAGPILTVVPPAGLLAM